MPNIYLKFAIVETCCKKYKQSFISLNLRIKNSVDQGRVVRKPVNAKPGLKVNRGNSFSGINVLSIAYVLCSLRLLMLKTKGQKI